MMKVQAFFGWCTVMNGLLLIFFSMIFMIRGHWIYRMHSTWFPISREAFNVSRQPALKVFHLKENRLVKEQVAKFFEITFQTVENYLGEYTDELSQNGYEIIKGNQLKALKMSILEMDVPETDFGNISKNSPDASYYRGFHPANPRRIHKSTGLGRRVEDMTGCGFSHLIILLLRTPQEIFDDFTNGFGNSSRNLFDFRHANLSTTQHYLETI